MTRSPSAPLALAGSLLLAAAVPGVLFLVDSRPFPEVAGGGVHQALYTLSLVGALALLVAVPRLGQLTSRAGRRLPAPLLTLALLATALTVATHFVQVFITPGLAEVAPAALDEADGRTMIGLIGSYTAFLLAWVAVGVEGLRRGVLPRVGGVLLVVGALAQVALGPVAAIPQGVALLLIARAASGRRGVVPAPAPAAA